MNLKNTITILLILLTSFCMAQDKFEISGKLSTIGKGRIVMLSYKNSDGKDVNDSVAVKKDGMPWIQVSNLKGFKSDIVVKYGIAAIPQNFLLNPEGIIIAKNLRGEDLYTKLEKLIQ